MPVREFRVDAYGAPPYPEVVFITSRRTLAQHADLLRRTLAAIQRGLQDTICHPPTVFAAPRQTPGSSKRSRANVHSALAGGPAAVPTAMSACGAGRRMDFEAADPDVIAAAIAEEIRREVEYRPVEADGAAPAAALIGELL
jgi:hypothetical protein